MNWIRSMLVSICIIRWLKIFDSKYKVKIILPKIFDSKRHIKSLFHNPGYYSTGFDGFVAIPLSWSDHLGQPKNNSPIKRKVWDTHKNQNPTPNPQNVRRRSKRSCHLLIPSVFIFFFYVSYPVCLYFFFLLFGLFVIAQSWAELSLVSHSATMRPYMRVYFVTI